MPAFLEERYRRKHLNCVRHITLDPKGHGVVRIHMIPPRQDAADAPFLLLLNGDKLVPLNLSWAILLANFMDRLEPFSYTINIQHLLSLVKLLNPRRIHRNVRL